MLQQYIRAPADLSVNVKTYQHGISGAVARDTPIPCDCTKKCQQCVCAFVGVRARHARLEDGTVASL